MYRLEDHSLDCVYDKDNLVPVINAPKEPLVIGYPRKSYKCLATVLEKSGRYEVDVELPGWDKPAEVQQFFLRHGTGQRQGT